MFFTPAFAPIDSAGGTPDAYSINTEGTDGGLESLNITGSEFGTGDFTIEAWVYATSLANTWNAVAGRHQSSAGGMVYVKSNGVVTFYQGGEKVSSAASTVTTSTWYHIAAVRSSGTLKIYVDGVEKDSAAYATNLTVDDFFIGQNTGDNEEFQGYIYRPHFLTSAKYTSGFTPTNAYEAEASTTMLVKANGTTFTDTEGNSITNNGATQQAAAP